MPPTARLTSAKTYADSLVVGTGANSVAIGSGADAQSANGIAIGTGATGVASSSIAICGGAVSRGRGRRRECGPGRNSGLSTAYVDEQVGSLRKEAFQGIATIRSAKK